MHSTPPMHITMAPYTALRPACTSQQGCATVSLPTGATPRMAGRAADRTLPGRMRVLRVLSWCTQQAGHLVPCWPGTEGPRREARVGAEKLTTSASFSSATTPGETWTVTIKPRPGQAHLVLCFPRKQGPREEVQTGKEKLTTSALFRGATTSGA